MATPTIFSDKADNAFSAKRQPQGVLVQKAIAAVPAAAADGTVVGMIRFQKGFIPTSFTIVSDDLDTGTDVLFDVGYVYDDSALTDDDNAFLDNIDIAQDAGSRLWPVEDGLLTAIGFEAEGDGYLTVTTRVAVTTTAGDVTMTCNFSYDRE